MKKAYNEIWVQNLAIQRLTQTWREKKLLSIEQWEAIKTNFPEEFYRPGIFVKIGLFIFATIACSFGSGFFSLFILGASNGGDGAIAFLSILSGLAFLFMLEYLIKARKLFHSGIDNALLYATVGAFIVPLFLLLPSSAIWQYCLFILPILVIALFRYADVFVAILTYVVLLTLVANLMIHFPLGKALLPFGIMLLAGIIYYFARKQVNVYYADCQTVTAILSLVTLYLGGNYLIVREGNAMLIDGYVPYSPQIPFASLFYFFTTIIPLVYIYFGLRQKNRILLITGLLALAFSIYTYRHYFSFLPLEWALALSGSVMILLAATSINYLKSPKFGLTDEQDGGRKLANLESIIIAQSLGQTPEDKKMEFGGGDFGGGGAGSKY